MSDSKVPPILLRSGEKMNFTIEKSRSTACRSDEQKDCHLTQLNGFETLKVFNVIKNSAIVVLLQGIQSRFIFSGYGETQIIFIRLF
jgi:hypothetical protein